MSVLISAQSYIDKKGETHLWGVCDLNDFQKDPYSKWYQKNITDFSSTLTKEDGKLFQNTKVKVFIGTWCGDTKSLFPKFIKSWEQMGLSQDQLEIIGLHHEGEEYKQGPNDETKNMDIHRVPTFVFYEDDKEIGRIVERTVFDLDTDLKLIAGQHPYRHRYSAIPIISELMTNNIDSLNSVSFLKKAIKKVDREVGAMDEFNIYGYTLLYSGDLEKAKFVFKVNSELFPYSPYTRYAFGKVLYVLKDYETAKPEFQEALRIKPDFEFPIKYLFEINEALKEAK